MKKFISLVFIFGFAGYAAYNYFSTSAPASASNAQASAQAITITDGANPSDSGVAAQTSSATAAGSPPPVDTPAPPAKATTVAPVKKAPTGRYADGTYTGRAADAYYGNIQVAVTVSGGKLTNVTFLQYPNDRSTSRMINQQAMPMLKAEAIQAQSANVSGVSGASDSSAAFKQSLASALAQA